MEYKNLLIEKEGNIAVVKIDRPELKNALNLPLLESIGNAFVDLEQDTEVNAVVLTGSDEVFCAGFDMNTLMDLGQEKMQKVDIIERAFLSVLRYPMPVIAAVSGPAIAAGFDLMVLADIRIFSETAKVGQSEIRWAVTPLNDPLWKIIGMGRAKEVTMTGRIYGAGEAKEMALANYVYPVDRYLEEAKKLARKIATFDRTAQKANKDQTNRIPGMDTEAAIRTQIWGFRNFVGSDEMIRRMSEFLNDGKKNQ
ncbi:3-hydroxybutyryl-coa dehydratase [hydrocarbon metagenome]|uniref:3-hydroxybutyryl-coa dehydratase n=1 Tax=hydrocarbon metagenome TaxID=938273 RepID=A0A0W8E7X4_9ZZZZ